MLEVEHLGSRVSSAIVHDSLGQHSNERAFSGVDVANDSASDIEFISCSHSAVQSIEIVLELGCLGLILSLSELFALLVGEVCLWVEQL